MRKWVYILPILAVSMSSCRKDNITPTSGTVTIDNTTSLGQTYYVYGFLFSQAKLVSTLNNAPHDITIDSDGTSPFFQTNNRLNSFHNAGEYTDAVTATAAFDTLTAKGISVWTGLASPLITNQLWIYRSGSECYAKIRIISTKSEVRDSHAYAECKFEWVYQPDGSLTFPGK
ncbi:MAG: hypothetical protein MUC93_07530 [Bacteroidales bacterium]|nr:hypothetical protein [Bacteroidales bacterium]